MPKAPDHLREFESLLKVVEILRGPGGCPWDLEQTHRSLTKYAIEEAYEYAEAVEGGDPVEMRSELGDLLLQVVLNAEIARQAGQFDIHDVIATLNEKMIRRHPHVFGDVQVKDSGEVLENWAAIKATEKSSSPKPILDVPSALPSLQRAHKIGSKTKDHAFDFADAEACWRKVEEELRELAEAKGAEERQSELGDVLFSLAQWARHAKLDAEQALRETNRRFQRRFEWAFAQAKGEGHDWSLLPDAEKDAYWERAKRALKPDVSATSS